MKIFKINSKEGIIYRMDIFPTSLSKDNKTIEFVTYGSGHRKTRKFEALEVELPDRGDKLSWLEICKIHESYGIGISEEYANEKTAGIVARQTILGKYSLYNKIKDIIPTDTNFNSFFELLKCDYMLSCFGLFLLDIIELDNILSSLDPDYDNNKATYKGETCSMNQYINQKYGAAYSAVIEKLLESASDSIIGKTEEIEEVKEEKNDIYSPNDTFIFRHSRKKYTLTIVEALDNDVVFTISPEIGLSMDFCKKLENGNYKSSAYIVHTTLTSNKAIKE